MISGIDCLLSRHPLSFARLWAASQVRCGAQKVTIVQDDVDWPRHYDHSSVRGRLLAA